MSGINLPKNAGILNSLDPLIACTGAQTMTQFIDHDFASNFGGFMDPFVNKLATLMTPVDRVSDFSSFLDLPFSLNVQSIVKYQILDQYRCKSLTGPSVITSTNMVIAPPANLTVNKYIVG